MIKTLTVVAILALGAGQLWGQPWNTVTGGISYTGGQVGMGTSTFTDPAGDAVELRVVSTQPYGVASFEGSGSYVGFFVNATNGGVPYVMFLHGATPNWTFTSDTSGLNIRRGNAIAASALTILNGGSVGIGTTSPCTNSVAPSGCKLSVAGAIQAQLVVVNTGWSDYVFQPGYRLEPLSEVKAFIQANHHLPDIPSAVEVKENGVDLGDMQAKLLAKVEELTLHMIQAEERSNRLEAQVQTLEKQLAEKRSAHVGEAH